MLARRLADNVGSRQKVSRPMDTLTQIALKACAPNWGAFDEILDTAEADRKGPFARVTP